MNKIWLFSLFISFYSCLPSDKFIILCLFLRNTDDIYGWVLYHMRPNSECDTAANRMYLSVLLEQTGDDAIITSHHISSHCIASHYITSHHIPSHCITSHRIASHLIGIGIASHYITSHPIASHRIATHRITSHHITSHHITCHITSHHII